MQRRGRRASEGRQAGPQPPIGRQPAARSAPPGRGWLRAAGCARAASTLLLALVSLACEQGALGPTPSASAWLEVSLALICALLIATALLLHRAGRRSSREDASRIAELGRNLEAEQARSHCLIDAIHDLVCTFDAEGQIAQINLRGLELLGHAANPSALKNLRDFVHPRFLPLLLSPFHTGPTGMARIDGGEVFARTRRGDALWLDVRMRKIVRDGQIVSAEAVGNNVTAKKSSEQSLAAYAGAVQAVAGAISLDGTVESALQTLCEQLGFDYAELWKVDAHYGVLRATSIWHVEEPGLAQVAERARSRAPGRGATLAGRVWALEASLYLPELDASPLSRKELDIDGEFHTALAFPVRLLGRVAGVMVLLTLGRSAVRAPALDMLDTLGAQIGQFAERKSAEQRLRESEARIGTVLESTIDCVITTDKDGRILDFNRAAERTFLHDRKDVFGRNVEDVIIPPLLRPQHRVGFQHYLATGERHIRGRIEVTALRADGSEIPIELAVTPIRTGSDPVFTAFLRDISDRKELERIKDELVSTVSHELRTPLASVRGFVELLLMREFTREEQLKFLGIIDTEIKRLTRLINDFLQVQRLEAGENRYELAEHDLCGLLRECVQVAAGSAGAHCFQVETPDAPLGVRIDADRMHQVVMNLLSNAVKFSPSGGTVRVRASDRGDRVEVSVRDQGIGMTPDVVQKIFRKFFRADSSATRAIEGTGLGLALVREIITAHRGEIRVESQPGVGSEFFFELPLARSEHKHAGASLSR